MQTMLTAYNEKVQEYILPPNKKAKAARLESLIDAIKSAGHVFEGLFSASKKRVLDEIIYLSSGGGVCKIAGDKLAERCDVSIRTVRAAVSAIKKVGAFDVGRIANERAGKYIFVDKSHEDYTWLMHDIFNVNAPQNAPQDARQIAPQQNAENAAPVRVEDENEAPICFSGLNGLSSRPALKSLSNIYNMPTQESEKLKTYAGTEALAFYERIISDATMDESIKENAYALALTLNDADIIDEVSAYDALRKINHDFDTHLRTKKSVRAVFKGAYERALFYRDRLFEQMSWSLQNKVRELDFANVDYDEMPF